MSKGNTTETEILALLFEATAMADLAQDDGSSPLTSLYIALHTADPGEAGSQTTSEAAYTSYARVAVSRSGSGWTTASGATTNDGAVTFPACTGSSATCTYFSIGKASSGAGQILYSGALTASLAVSTGITPSFAAGDIDVTED